MSVKEFKLLLHQVVMQREPPFSVDSPNAITVAAMEAFQQGMGLEVVTLEQLAKKWEVTS